MSSEYPEADRREGAPHPRETFDLLGHEAAEAVFQTARANGRLHHAWMITGPEGVGKATLAYRMARSLLGGRSLLEGGLDIPASDPVAQRIAAQGHGNLRVLRREYDFQSKKVPGEIRVGDARDFVRFFQETPSEQGAFRVGIIDKADEMNASAANAVLKIIEEPPERGVVFILSDAPGRLLPTIRSRCVSLDLRPVGDEQLRPWLAARTELGKEFERVLWLSRGSPGRAVAMANTIDSVVKPLTRLAEMMHSDRVRGNDVMMAGQLSGAKLAEERALFWSGAQDLLAAAAKAAGGAAWTAPFAKPDPARDWQGVWAEAVERERVEGEINMDARASLLDMLGRVRAA